MFHIVGLGKAYSRREPAERHFSTSALSLGEDVLGMHSNFPATLDNIGRMSSKVV